MKHEIGYCASDSELKFTSIIINIIIMIVVYIERENFCAIKYFIAAWLHSLFFPSLSTSSLSFHSFFLSIADMENEEIKTCSSAYIT